MNPPEMQLFPQEWPKLSLDENVALRIKRGTREQVVLPRKYRSRASIYWPWMQTGIEY